jgi:hypothetical protein
MYVRFPLSLRTVEDLLFEQGIEICHETVRHCWNRYRQTNQDLVRFASSGVLQMARAAELILPKTRTKLDFGTLALSPNQIGKNACICSDNAVKRLRSAEDRHTTQTRASSVTKFAQPACCLRLYRCHMLQTCNARPLGSEPRNWNILDLDFSGPAISGLACHTKVSSPICSKGAGSLSWRGTES